MPPILALFICTTFVLFLLRLEHKQTPNVSLALWIPTFWMLLTASKPLGIWFGSGGVSLEEGSALDRMVLSALFLIGLVILIKRQFNWSRAIKENHWVIILLVYMFVSILWSEMPFVSFKRWMRNLIAVVMVFLVATELEPKEAVKSILRRMIYILIPFSYILIHYFPEYGRDYGRWSGELMWIGVASQKNGLALLCVISILFLSWTVIRKRKGQEKNVSSYQTLIEIFLLLLTIRLFMGPNYTLTYSATSLVALIIGLTVQIGLFRFKRMMILLGLNLFFSLMLFIIAYGTITPFIGKLAIIDISYILNRNETLTERTEIWAYLIPYVMKKPFLGHGVGGFWTDEMREATSSHAHNGYLDIILNLGILGLFLFSFFLISCYKKFIKIQTFDVYWGGLGICFLFVALIHNIAESSVIGLTGSLSGVILLIRVSLNNYRNNLK